jgi:hypothetical protein
VVPHATHLLAEPGALEQVAGWAAEWFDRYLAGEDLTMDGYLPEPGGDTGRPRVGCGRPSGCPAPFGREDSGVELVEESAYRFRIDRQGRIRGTASGVSYAIPDVHWGTGFRLWRRWARSNR